jgi:hypothetical protein
VIRILPYLGGLFFIALLFFLAVLVYRYATRNDRLAPKRTLANTISQLEADRKMTDKLLEELVSDATASSDTEPVLAHSVLRKVHNHQSQLSNNKEYK